MVDVFIDFETYYGTGYSLRLQKYNTTSYIHDDQFLIHCVHICCGICEYAIHTDYDAEDPYWEMRELFDSPFIDWKDVNLVAHNVLFDGYILYAIFGITAGRYSCTLAMARAVFQGETQSNELGVIATRLGHGDKVPQVLDKTRNIRRVEGELRDELQHYNAVDTRLCREIYYEMLDYMLPNEVELMNLTYQMFCDPVLELDEERCQAELEAQIKKRRDAVAETGYAEANFSSAPKYAALLERWGVEVPLKWSEKKKCTIPAVAKDDLEYLELVDTWTDERLLAFARARELCASSIHITRPQRFLDNAKLNNKFPMAYHYFGAMNTGRWSGANKINAQNLPRINPDDPTSGQLRLSLRAPKGHVICVQDYKAIEPRTNAYRANQQDMVQAFLDGIDQYCDTASDIFGKTVTPDMKQARFVGKVVEIACGYGMGWRKYRHTLAIGQFGDRMIIDADLAQLAVNTYRHKRSRIRDRWYQLDEFLKQMTFKDCNFTDGPFAFRHQRVYLPSGRYLYYPGLHFNDDGDTVYWSQKYKNWTKIYGGMFCENLVQAEARDVLGYHMTIIAREVARPVLSTHDETAVIAPEADGEATCAAMAEIMAQPPPWAPGLPLEVDGGFAREYSK
jgi:DNA polymerase